MNVNLKKSVTGFIVSAGVLGFALTASAFETSGKLLLTSGVTQIEGASGGGLTPWAFIGGYETDNEVIGASAFYTTVDLQDYGLTSYGGLVGLYDRVEISYARQIFDTRDLGRILGLGQGFKINQNVLGVKVKVYGDGVLDQDSWLPQIAVGAQYKTNEEAGLLAGALGAQDTSGTDYYVSATKLYLDQSILVNVTLRATKANQLGILGFGSTSNNNYQFMPEASLAYLVDRKVAVGAEYRFKPNNLASVGLKLPENNWSDLFVAWTPTRNISLTGAFVSIGNVAINSNESGAYASLQVAY